MSELTATRYAAPLLAASRGRAIGWESLQVRIATVLVALLILYIRMPANFTNPQFWAEDGPTLFRLTEIFGARSVLLPTAGYYMVFPWLVAIVAKIASPAWAPWIYNYTGAAVALFVVYLATSPRFAMPLRPLLALAVVTVPQGFETLGALANSMWVLPIAAFILLFSAPASKTVLAGEALFLGIQGLTGPFSLFLLPLYAIRLAMLRHDRESYRRLRVLTIVVASTALIQVASLYIHRAEALGIPIAVTFPWRLWITLPLYHAVRSFGSWAGSVFVGTWGFVAALLVALVAGIAALREPYRAQKLMMAAFGLIIALSGMLKFGQLVAGADRYFYIASVFGLWFIGCAAQHGLARYAGPAVILVAEAVSVFNMIDTPRQREDFEWPVWASYLYSGMPVKAIPIAPGWEMSMSASPTGPLSSHAAWPGQTFAELGQRVLPTACAGSFESLERDTYFDASDPAANGTRATAKGWAWIDSANRPPRLIVITDEKQRVVGLGLPGFKSAATRASSHPRSDWIATLATDSAIAVRAYAVLDDGQGVCPLQKVRGIPRLVADFTAGAFVLGIPITPGTKIVQRLGVSSNHLSKISFSTVTWKATPSPYVVEWRVLSVAGDSRRVIASGELFAKDHVDWQSNRLAIAPTTDDLSGEIEIEFFARPNQTAPVPLGLPLNRRRPDSRVPPVEIDGVLHPDLVMALTAEEGG